MKIARRQEREATFTMHPVKPAMNDEKLMKAIG